MDIQIGPHLYRNTDGTIEIEGVPQIEIAAVKHGGPFRVNFAVFDGTGKMPAKIVNNSLAVNEARAYNLRKNSTSLLLTKTDTQEDILRIDWMDGNRITISKGQFYTLQGHLFKITPLEWSVHKTTERSGETDLGGQPIRLG